ncbi:AraC family transcriptional regulator [Agriterribacter sp.]|uniref:helix-turn-helix domain-containing protein n=1 Tax=Agriterribacter sp. TaxID=2821509 RepID=UPI002C517E22|nr:AraC family transcriptional regulator [Agriterribacter sp.]HTN06086.1 AraC family transcriptional regulator [Agriterribacter sp.]
MVNACKSATPRPGIYEEPAAKDLIPGCGYIHPGNETAGPGYRGILAAMVYSIKDITRSKKHSLLLPPLYRAKELVMNNIAAFQGKELKWETDDSLMGVFNDAALAVQCAIQIRQRFIQSQAQLPEIVLKIGVSLIQPPAAEGNLFYEAIKLAHYLSLAVRDNGILISALAKNYCRKEQLLPGSTEVKWLTIKEERFLSSLMRIAEYRLADQYFNLNSISSEICISRPQLYRKIIALTGRSPHHFMLDLRMNKATILLKQEKTKIAEIAYQTGFSSPSYFTKCFSEKFGCTPSCFTKINAC